MLLLYEYGKLVLYRKQGENMLKNKYQRMTSDEKKDLKDKYYKTKEGLFLKQKLFNSRLYALLLLIWAAVNIVLMIKDQTYTFVNITLTIFGIGFAILFIALAFKIESDKLNYFAIENEKKYKKPSIEEEIENEYKNKKKKKK